MRIQSREGQCLVDIALAVTGTTEGVWALALRNGMSVTGKMDCGTVIDYENEDVEDARTIERYAAEGICPATGVSDRLLAWLLDKCTVDTLPDYSDIKADAVKAQATRAAVFAGEFTATFS